MSSSKHAAGVKQRSAPRSSPAAVPSASTWEEQLLGAARPAVPNRRQKKDKRHRLSAASGSNGAARPAIYNAPELLSRGTFERKRPDKWPAVATYQDYLDHFERRQARYRFDASSRRNTPALMEAAAREDAASDDERARVCKIEHSTLVAQVDNDADVGGSESDVEVECAGNAPLDAGGNNGVPIPGPVSTSASASATFEDLFNQLAIQLGNISHRVPSNCEQMKHLMRKFLTARKNAGKSLPAATRDAILHEQNRNCNIAQVDGQKNATSLAKSSQIASASQLPSAAAALSTLQSPPPPPLVEISDIPDEHRIVTTAERFKCSGTVKFRPTLTSLPLEKLPPAQGRVYGRVVDPNAVYGEFSDRVGNADTPPIIYLVVGIYNDDGKTVCDIVTLTELNTITQANRSHRNKDNQDQADATTSSLMEGTIDKFNELQSHISRIYNDQEPAELTNETVHYLLSLLVVDPVSEDIDDPGTADCELNSSINEKVVRLARLRPTVMHPGGRINSRFLEFNVYFVSFNLTRCYKVASYLAFSGQFDPHDPEDTLVRMRAWEADDLKSNRWYSDLQYSSSNHKRSKPRRQEPFVGFPLYCRYSRLDIVNVGSNLLGANWLFCYEHMMLRAVRETTTNYFKYLAILNPEASNADTHWLDCPLLSAAMGAKIIRKLAKTSDNRAPPYDEKAAIQGFLAKRETRHRRRLADLARPKAGAERPPVDSDSSDEDQQHIMSIPGDVIIKKERDDNDDDIVFVREKIWAASDSQSTRTEHSGLSSHPTEAASRETPPPVHLQLVPLLADQHPHGPSSKSDSEHPKPTRKVAVKTPRHASTVTSETISSGPRRATYGIGKHITVGDNASKGKIAHSSNGESDYTGQRSSAEPRRKKAPKQSKTSSRNIEGRDGIRSRSRSRSRSSSRSNRRSRSSSRSSSSNSESEESESQSGVEIEMQRKTRRPQNSGKKVISRKESRKRSPGPGNGVEINVHIGTNVDEGVQHQANRRSVTTPSHQQQQQQQQPQQQQQQQQQQEQQQQLKDPQGSSQDDSIAGRVSVRFPRYASVSTLFDYRLNSIESPYLHADKFTVKINKADTFYGINAESPVLYLVVYAFHNDVAPVATVVPITSLAGYKDLPRKWYEHQGLVQKENRGQLDATRMQNNLVLRSNDNLRYLVSHVVGNRRHLLLNQGSTRIPVVFELGPETTIEPGLYPTHDDPEEREEARMASRKELTIVFASFSLELCELFASVFDQLDTTGDIMDPKLVRIIERENSNLIEAGWRVIENPPPAQHQPAMADGNTWLGFPWYSITENISNGNRAAAAAAAAVPAAIGGNEWGAFYMIYSFGAITFRNFMLTATNRAFSYCNENTTVWFATKEAAENARKPLACGLLPPLANTVFGRLLSEETSPTSAIGSSVVAEDQEARQAALALDMDTLIVSNGAQLMEAVNKTRGQEQGERVMFSNDEFCLLEHMVGHRIPALHSKPVDNTTVVNSAEVITAIQVPGLVASSHSRTSQDPSEGVTIASSSSANPDGTEIIHATAPINLLPSQTTFITSPAQYELIRSDNTLNMGRGQNTLLYDAISDAGSVEGFSPCISPRNANIPPNLLPRTTLSPPMNPSDLFAPTDKDI